jgi:alpha-tubulin suppressor-like RCC1 family protein
LTLNWGNHNALFSFSGHKEEVGYSGFQTHDVETIEYLNDTIFRGFVQKLPLSDVNILKLDKQNLVLSKGFGNHGNRLELTKN